MPALRRPSGRHRRRRPLRASSGTSSRRCGPSQGAGRLPRDLRRRFPGVAPDPKIIALTKKQSEFVRPIWEYVNGAISAAAPGARPAARRTVVRRLLRQSSGPTAFPARSSSASGAWRRISAASRARSPWCGPSRPSPTPAIGATSSARSFSPRCRSWSRTISNGTPCSAPGRAPWGRPSSCRRAS